MTPDEFMDRYCDGMVPTPAQLDWITALLTDVQGLPWAGRGAGKSTFLGWARGYFADLDKSEVSHADP